MFRFNIILQIITSYTLHNNCSTLSQHLKNVLLFALIHYKLCIGIMMRICRTFFIRLTFIWTIFSIICFLMCCIYCLSSSTNIILISFWFLFTELSNYYMHDLVWYKIHPLCCLMKLFQTKSLPFLFKGRHFANSPSLFINFLFLRNMYGHPDASSV